MKAIQKIFPKPSDAVFSMVEGLKEYSKSKYFEVTMDSYGHSRGHICYGCAATCAIQNKVGTYSPNEINNRYGRLQKVKNKYKIRYNTLLLTEEAIDMLRCGCINIFMSYYAYKGSANKKLVSFLENITPLPTMREYNINKINKYKEFGNQLKTLGY